MPGLNGKLLTVLLLGAGARMLGAQAADATRSGFPARHEISRVTVASDSAEPARHVMAARTMMGAIAFIPGAVLGVSIAVSASNNSRHCSGDYCGLDRALLGAWIGGSVASALVASSINGNHRCSYGERFGYGLTGAALGSLLGSLAAAAAPGVVVISVPLGAGVGTASMENGC